MPKLTIQERNFVVHTRGDGHGYGTIVAMLEGRGTKVSKTTVRKLCRKFEATGLVADKKRVIRRPGQFGTDEHKAFIDECMNAQPDMTAKTLSDSIFDRFGIRMSEARVCAIRRDAGWTQHATRYCQLIREPNKVKRVEWCQRMIDSHENFDVSYPAN